MKKIAWFCAALLAVVVLGLFLKHPAPRSAGIHIGAVLGLTGDAATDALNIKRGIDLAKDDLAKQGVEVEIVYQDDHTDPKQTVSAIRYLLSTAKPQAIIGPTWSFLEDAAAPVIAQEKIIAYAPADTSEFVNVRSPYQFHGAPRNALSVKPMVAWMLQHGSKRIAIITDSSAWGLSRGFRG
jgi:branched-chain amino acid transport system substrate-binding protein